MSQSLDTPLIREEEAQRLAVVRQRKDRFANIAIQFGGFSVIIAITLIFVYLLIEVWPLFKSGHMDKAHSFPTEQLAPTALSLSVDEYGDTGINIAPNGHIHTFMIADGKAISEDALGLPEGVTVSSVAHAQTGSPLQALGLSNGQIMLVRPDFQVDYNGKTHQVTPSLQFPYGKVTLPFDDNGQPLQHFALITGDDGFDVLGQSGSKLLLTHYEQKKAAVSGGGLGLSSALDDGSGSTSDAPKEYVRGTSKELPWQPVLVKSLLLGAGGRWVYVVGNRDDVQVIKIPGDEAPKLYERLSLFHGARDISAVDFLMGENSLLVGDSNGNISQWFMARDPKSDTDDFHLAHVRDFQLGKSPVTALQSEHRRKGFLAGDAMGNVGLYYTTSERTIAVQKALEGPVSALALTYRGQGLLVQSNVGTAYFDITNEHPDVSVSSLWQRVWYEGYPTPGYTWQSSSGSTDFEAKLSLVPLTFGTIKAAFWAMILAAPLAIFGAMYTAIFMAPKLRSKVKPAIELMQALPTVILGFLAGLWLAPVTEQNLPGIFSLLIVTPLVILLCGYLWWQMPRHLRARVPEGWLPLLLMGPIAIGAYLSFALSQPIELAFFGGDMRHWLEAVLGLKFDQRNALVVGLVMGFAVIAPIFSISEDALFAVPKHLTNGSLALGATQWQTLVRVVLPTAMPGIFSAFMIGFGRAVGETMIVLMATGNTPVTNWNIFEGMRTLSANVAVEMGEAEVGSTHFRVLFLSALVLFVLTFVLNTIAEVVRTRLRKKYGSL